MSEETQAIDYLGMAQFLKPRGYSISENIACFPGGMSAICADDDDAYQMAFGHFLAGELGRKWALTWESIEQVGRVFDKQEIEAIEQAIRFYEALEAIT